MMDEDWGPLDTWEPGSDSFHESVLISHALEALCTAASAVRRCATYAVPGRSDEPSDAVDEARGPARTARSSSCVAPAGPEAAAIPVGAQSAAEEEMIVRTAIMAGAAFDNAGLADDSAAVAGAFKASSTASDFLSNSRSIASRKFFNRCHRSATCRASGAASAAA